MGEQAGGDVLLEALHDHNPWWDGATVDRPTRHKSDFYHLVRPTEDETQFESVPLLALVGRRGVGKTTLLHEFVQHQIDEGDDPERFCLLPFDADPRFQLRSDEQLRRAVRHYESRILGKTRADAAHFLLCDDVHRIEHSTKPSTDGWGTVVDELLEGEPHRHVVVTATAGTQIDREAERAGIDVDRYDIQPILPEKFRDYIFSLYPDLEAEPDRLSPTSIRTGPASLPAALETGEVEPLLEELQTKHKQVAGEMRAIQSQVVEYLVMGGVLSFRSDGPVASAADLPDGAYEDLRETVRQALYQDAPAFGSIQTVADLERLCAVAAHRRADPIRLAECADLFDVDRRTITESYLPTLAQLYCLTGVTEFDNSRPRTMQLYLRDTGLVTALTAGDPSAIRSDRSLEADLARLAGFDHTMRLDYMIHAVRGTASDPAVAFWNAPDGQVDYVFQVDKTPVPVGLAYRSSEYDDTLAALEAFQDTYDSPVSLLLTGDELAVDEPVSQLDSGGIRLPYWLYLMLC